jgi:hypothetical protein
MDLSSFAEHLVNALPLSRHVDTLVLKNWRIRFDEVRTQGKLFGELGGWLGADRLRTESGNAGLIVRGRYRKRAINLKAVRSLIVIPHDRRPGISGLDSHDDCSSCR